MDMDYLRVAEKVVIEADEPSIRLKFPDPTWPPGVAEGSPLIQMESFSFGYKTENQKDDNYLLRDLTLNVNRGSKIAVVGNNGSGKSTLLKLLTGDIQIPKKEKYSHKGNLSWKHSNLRIGHMTQYSVEELNEFTDMTVVEYAEEKLSKGKASSGVIKEASGNVRQYLGAFGLGGIHAHRKIEKLSGGERMRLCFATVFAEEPHVLFLDEATNHVDVETLDSMASALNNYQGAVVMVSHNQSFLNGFCKELWVVEDGQVTCNYDDTETFDELFSDYRNSVLADIGGSTLSNKRKEKATMAKKAKQNRAGAKQNVALL